MLNWCTTNGLVLNDLNSVSDAKLIRGLPGRGKKPKPELLILVTYSWTDCLTRGINNGMESSEMESWATETLHSINQGQSPNIHWRGQRHQKEGKGELKIKPKPLDELFLLFWGKRLIDNTVCQVTPVRLGERVHWIARYRAFSHRSNRSEYWVRVSKMICFLKWTAQDRDGSFSSCSHVRFSLFREVVSTSAASLAS